MTAGVFVRAAALGLLVLLPFVLAGDAYHLGLATRILIFALAAVGLDLVLGHGGLVSLGHAAFLGIGAYAVGILATHGVLAAPIHWAVALAVAGAFALFVGAVSLRTTGVAFIMITLAFGQMLFFLMVSLKAYGGDDGITLWDAATLGPLSLGDDRTLYWVALAALAVGWTVAGIVTRSRFGLALDGARQDAGRVEALGFAVTRIRLAAFVLSGLLTTLAGCLLAHATDFVSPAYMSWQRSGELVVMVVLGGMRTRYGPMIGAAAFLLLEEVLAGLTVHWMVILGPLLVLVALLGRGGIVGFAMRLRR